jgi:hypothetical protein
MKQKQNNIWKIIAKSLGEKSGDTDKESDQVAVVRLIAFLSILITNSFIVANALRHWNDIQLDKPVKCIIVDKL